LWSIESFKIQLAFELINKDWKLFMIHFQITDVLAHLKPNNIIEQLKLYKKFDDISLKI